MDAGYRMPCTQRPALFSRTASLIRRVRRRLVRSVPNLPDGTEDAPPRTAVRARASRPAATLRRAPQTPAPAAHPVSRLQTDDVPRSTTADQPSSNRQRKEQIACTSPRAGTGGIARGHVSRAAAGGGDGSARLQLAGFRAELGVGDVVARAARLRHFGAHVVAMDHEFEVNGRVNLRMFLRLMCSDLHFQVVQRDALFSKNRNDVARGAAAEFQKNELRVVQWPSPAPNCLSMRAKQRQGLPRTSASSTITTRLPSTTSRTGLYFMRGPKSRSCCCGWMNVRPT